MVGGPIGSAICVLVGIGLFVVGFSQLAVCGQGLSLILFGGAILSFGLAIFPAGGAVVLGMAGFTAFLLVVVGLVLAHGAGCNY